MNIVPGSVGLDPSRRTEISQVCFAISFALGCFCLFMVLVEEAMPAASLDVVLTQEELKDPATCQKTMEILTKAGGFRWIFWAFAGITTILTSGIGLWATSGWNDLKKLSHLDEPKW